MAPPGNPAMASGGSTPYRQLKVEDALAYLDQVKMKFEKQPHIYNKVRAAPRSCAPPSSPAVPACTRVPDRLDLPTHRNSRGLDSCC